MNRKDMLRFYPLIVVVEKEVILKILVNSHYVNELLDK